MIPLVLLACQPDSADPDAPVSLAVAARWTAEPGGITWEQAEAGLAWSLTNLGALPPPDGWLDVTESDGNTVYFTLHLDRVGFDRQASEALLAAVAPVQGSDELAALGSVDVGRLLMRTLYSPWRYYGITGACADFSDWAALSQGEDTEHYGITVSLLTEDDRLITLNAGPYSLEEIGFVARSGAGVLHDPAVTQELEVIDLMRSGQQRYAVYDAAGRLAPAADPAVIAAGQPGRCMWCHEGSLMIGTPVNPTTRPHLSYLQWRARMAQMQAVLDEHRAGLETSVDFTDRQAHTHGELLVREFLRPTPERMSREWGISGDALAELLAEYDVEYSLDEEYPDRGPVLSRADLDAVYADAIAAPGFQTLPILPDDREAPEDWDALDGAGELAPGCWRP